MNPILERKFSYAIKIHKVEKSISFLSFLGGFKMEIKTKIRYVSHNLLLSSFYQITTYYEISYFGINFNRKSTYIFLQCIFINMKIVNKITSHACNNYTVHYCSCKMYYVRTLGLRTFSLNNFNFFDREIRLVGNLAGPSNQYDHHRHHRHLRQFKQINLRIVQINLRIVQLI